ncbi:MAG: galactose mutarotase [Clostridiales bacterium]|nr:galactose mutarotase [Clostridiales bacterium]
MEKTHFGTLMNDEGIFEIYGYTLENADITVTVLNLGGIIQTFSHRGTEIVCGFDTLEDYLADTSYQGAVVGRYANRIRDGVFSIGGKTYKLAKNADGMHHLHGGKQGFNRKVFDVAKKGRNALVLSYLSPDGEEGYPGNLSVKVTYTLHADALAIRYEAVSDADTYVNLTNHAYFNLCGITGGDVLSHELLIPAGQITELDENLTATGRRIDVAGTPYDFNRKKPVGRDIAAVSGYDNNYILSGEKNVSFDGRGLRLAAELSCGGRTLTVLTDKPCMQLYTANFLGEGSVPFKGGTPAIRHHALCLETQYEPNSPAMGQTLLSVGERYDTMTVFRLA